MIDQSEVRRQYYLGAAVEGEEAEDEDEAPQTCQGNRVTRDILGFTILRKPGNLTFILQNVKQEQQ